MRAPRSARAVQTCVGDLLLADSVHDLWEWFTKSFEADPAGWLALLLALAAIVLSAVFWRRLWAFLKWFGRGVGRIVLGVSRLRITTVDRLPRHDLLVPARWVIRPKNGGQRGQYVLGNVSEGSVAKRVILHSMEQDVQIVSAAAWDEIPGGMAADVSMSAREGAFWMGAWFRIEWDDQNGKRQYASWQERWD